MKHLPGLAVCCLLLLLVGCGGDPHAAGKAHAEDVFAATEGPALGEDFLLTTHAKAHASGNYARYVDGFIDGAAASLLGPLGQIDVELGGESSQGELVATAHRVLEELRAELMRLQHIPAQ